MIDGRTGIGLCISWSSTDDADEESDREGGLGFAGIGWEFIALLKRVRMVLCDVDVTRPCGR